MTGLKRLRKCLPAYWGYIAWGCAVMGAVAPLKAGELTLLPHKVRYALTLTASEAGGPSSARGSADLEILGNPCDGYATNFSQNMELLDSDGNARRLEFRSTQWEDGGGNVMRFTNHTRINGVVMRDIEGVAKRTADGGVSVVFSRPAGKKADLPGQAIFPNQMTLQLIEAAKRGERFFSTQLFDGSENGDRIQTVIATISPEMGNEAAQKLEKPLREGLQAQTGMRHWPITVNYYEADPETKTAGGGDQIPTYAFRSVTFENGVMGDLRFRLPDFSLKGQTTQFKALQGEGCKP